MPVNKVRRRGSYAPLSAHAYKDDALAEAGEAAELLFYRGLSFAADVINDGFISDTQLVRFPGAGMRDAQKRARRLVDVGLWVREDGGYRIKSWLKWNRSRAEIEHLQRKDAGRKADPTEDPDGSEPVPESDSERNPFGIQSESEPRADTSPNGFHPHARKPDTEPDTEPTPDVPRAAKRATRAPTHLLVTAEMRDWARDTGITVDLDAETETFLDHHRAKGSAFKDWRAAWRTWMRNSIKFGGAQSRPSPASEDEYEPPQAPREVVFDPDPGALQRWHAEQRALWDAERGRV